MVISLSDLNNTNNHRGLTIPGNAPGDRLGGEVYSGGDLNGDGIDDLVVTATDAGIPSTDADSYYDNDRRGEAYVVFGNSNNSQTVDLTNLNGNNGFSVSGLDAEHNLGTAVSAGDLNGDGIDDLVLGAANAGARVSSYGNAYSESNGETYVIFGRQNGFNSEIDLNNLNGNSGFTLEGVNPSDLLGTAIASAGDLNGDGIDDLAVSAVGAGQGTTNKNGFASSDMRGEVYVLFGKNDGFNSQFNLSNLNGNNGFVLEGRDANDSLGGSLSNGGDINGDGIDDLVIGAAEAGDVLDSPFANGYSDQRGEVYVVFGSRDGFEARTNVTQLLNGNNGFAISGIGIEDSLGSDVNSIGDLNGDGIEDLILGADRASVAGEYTQEGQAYVVFGRQGGFGSQFDLNSLNGSNGFSLAGIDANDGLGNAVSAGDFNGDGIDDLLVGASNGGENLSADGYDYSDRRGEAYVIFGRQTGFSSEIDLANLDSNSGVKIAGISPEDMLGNAVSSGGDLNNDGTDDLVISATDVDLSGEYTREGSTYVIFGETELIIKPPTDATPFSDNLTGTSNNDTIFGLGGDDTISGLGGDDSLLGDDGGDSLIGGSGADTLAGGNNNDTLVGEGGTDLLLGGNNQDRLIGNGKNDTLIGGTDNDYLEGGVGDDILIGVDLDRQEVQLGEQDTLVGSSGADLFVLGDEDRVYYDDRNSSTEGSTDYGFIKDFNSSQDKIQLKGDRSLYKLAFYTDAVGNRFANIFYAPAGDIPERVGIIKNVAADLTLDSPGFVFLVDSPIDVEQPIDVEPPTNITGTATPFNDEITGSNQDDVIAGQSGDDTILGGDGNDNLNGEAGGDSLFGDRGNDSLNGGNNNDTLLGGAGDDVLNGDSDQDRLVGEAGNDLLLGGTENDLLEGGAGDDTLIGVNYGNLDLQLGEQDTLVGGVGRDFLILGDSDRLFYDDRNPQTSGSTDYALVQGFDFEQDQIQLQGDSGLYRLATYNSGGTTFANLFYQQPGTVAERIAIIENPIENLATDNAAFVYKPFEVLPEPIPEPIPELIPESEATVNEATPYSDNIKGSSGSDSIAGKSGDDTISGGDGNDELAGDNGNDSLFGDGGNDTISGGNNNDTLFGAAGNDTLDGSNNQDRLVGDKGNDLLLGGNDNDLLEGGLGDDTLIGINGGNTEVQLGEQDTLIGGAGSDLFFLGDRDRIYYDDRNAETSGNTDYAVIRDLDTNLDTIHLKGDSSLYELEFYTDGSGTNSANIFYLEPGSSPERIGIIENAASDLTMDNRTFYFV